MYNALSDNFFVPFIQPNYVYLNVQRIDFFRPSLSIIFNQQNSLSSKLFFLFPIRTSTTSKFRPNDRAVMSNFDRPADLRRAVLRTRPNVTPLVVRTVKQVSRRSTSDAETTTTSRSTRLPFSCWFTLTDTRRGSFVSDDNAHRPTNAHTDHFVCINASKTLVSYVCTLQTTRTPLTSSTILKKLVRFFFHFPRGSNVAILALSPPAPCFRHPSTLRAVFIF